MTDNNLIHDVKKNVYVDSLNTYHLRGFLTYDVVFWTFLESHKIALLKATQIRCIECFFLDANLCCRSLSPKNHSSFKTLQKLLSGPYPCNYITYIHIYNAFYTFLYMLQWLIMDNSGTPLRSWTVSARDYWIFMKKQSPEVIRATLTPCEPKMIGQRPQVH